MQNVKLFFFSHPLRRQIQVSGVEVVSCVHLTSVCISTPAVTATRIALECPKCAVIKKSGELSCCAPGGAWFKNCGTSGNSNTEHTWVEGVQACKGVVGLFSGNAEAQFIVMNQTTTAQQLSDVEKQTIDPTLATHLYNAHTKNSKDNDQLSYIVVFTNVLFILFLNIQT